MGNDDLITVCAVCLRASCWSGDHICMKCKFTGTVEKTVGELRRLDLEHPHYWEKQLRKLR